MLRKPLLLAGIGALVFWPVTASAQIVLDGTLGSGGSLSGPQFHIPSTVGKTVGANLFHSFSDFNLASGESANFSGPNSINNILSRVTGGRPSSINGALNSTIPGANFFFLNPSGVIFGEQASVNVEGDFIVSTADFLRMSDGGVFHAGAPSSSVLSSAPVAAFGFMGPQAQAIQLNGTKLQTAKGQSLSLIGGDMNMRGGQLQAMQGNINLVSVGSAGEVKLDSANPIALLELDGFSKLGNINMSEGTVVSTSDGSNLVHAHNLKMNNSGIALEKTIDGIEAVGQGIIIKLGGDLEATNGGGIITVNEGSSSPLGNDISIEAKRVMLAKAFIRSQTSDSGKGGNISVRADDIVLEGALEGADYPFPAGISSQADGNISIEAKNLQVLNGSTVTANTSVNGAGGDIHIKADAIVLDSQTAKTKSRISTGAFIGVGGELRVETKNLQVLNGSVISTESNFGIGGNVIIKADQIILKGQRSKFMNGIQSETLHGRGGNISIEAKNLQVLNGSTIETTSGLEGFGFAKGGDILIKADHIVLDSQGIVDNAILAHSYADGSSGNISIEAKRMALNQSYISSSAFGRGSAGTIQLKVNDLQLTNNSAIAAISIREFAHSRSGNIKIEANTIQLLKGAIITSDSLGDGQAGDIVIKADSIIINSQGSENYTGISSKGDSTTLLGGAGSVKIKATNIELKNGQISTDNFSSIGNAGNITIEADTLNLSKSSSISASTYSDEFIEGNSGTISLKAQELTLDGGSIIQVDALVQQNGGNLNIEAGQLRLNNGSLLSAATSGSGQGGSIHVQVGTIELNNSSITASSVPSADDFTPGDAGSIKLKATNGIRLTGTLNADGTRRTSISTFAPKSNAGIITLDGGTTIVLDNSEITSSAGKDGGSVSLKANRLIHLRESEVDAKASNDGGNIFIDPRFVILDRSNLRADAVNGNGGNIQIRAKVFVPSAESQITASSEFGVDGNVNIEAPNTNLGTSLVRLPSGLLSAEKYLQESCLVLKRGRSSSFTIKRRQSAAPEPPNLLPSLGAK